MKRRDFLKNSAIIGAAAGTTGVATVATSCGFSSANENGFVKYEGEPATGILLETFENEYLRYELYDDATAVVTDKKNDNYKWDFRPVAHQELGEVEEGQSWMRTTRSMYDQYPGRFVLQKSSEGFKASLIGREERYWGSFTFNITLEDKWLNFTITHIDNTIPSLSFPSSIKCDELVLPRGIGEVLPVSMFGTGSIFAREIFPFFSQMNMRWMGGQKDGHAWMTVFDEGFEDAAAHLVRGALTPFYMRSLSQWRHGYTMKYCFVKGNYVTLAKTYREWFKSKGWFNPLTEKVKRSPYLSGFLGGRAFWVGMAQPQYTKTFSENFLVGDEGVGERPASDVIVYRTYDELTELIEQLTTAGMKKGFLKIAGWINRGFDASHPDVWPPEPKLGDVAKLKKILEQKQDIVTGLHDNNMDMYESTESFPKGINVNKDGSLMIGGAWAGGQAYIMHMKHGFAYGKRNWEKIKSLDPAVMYIDTTTAVQLYQSYEKKPLTKADDLQAKREMIEFYKNEGVIFGSEDQADFAIPGIDFYENRHLRKQGLTVPLWPLVFHDAAFFVNYESSGMNGNHPRWLEVMQWGYMMHFSATGQFNEMDLFKQTFHVDDWHARVGMAEMTDHRFLNDEKTLELSVFSTGDAIVCNYDTKPLAYEGKTIQPAGYLIVNG